MQQFMVKSSHTAEECLQILDESAARGSEALSQWKWGGSAGDHTAHAMVEAGSEPEVWEQGKGSPGAGNDRRADPVVPLDALRCGRWGSSRIEWANRAGGVRRCWG